MNVIVDTSAWLALEDRGDQYHSRAAQIAERLRKDRIPWITTEYIFLETVTLIRVRLNHRAATFFGDRILSSRLVEIVEINQTLRDEAWQIFKQYDDKSFSFVDCSSFALMRSHQIKKAFSFDHHFHQMGFEVL